MGTQFGGTLQLMVNWVEVQLARSSHCFPSAVHWNLTTDQGLSEAPRKRLSSTDENSFDLHCLWSDLSPVNFLVRTSVHVTSHWSPFDTRSYVGSRQQTAVCSATLRRHDQFQSDVCVTVTRRSLVSVFNGVTSPRGTTAYVGRQQ